LLAAAAVLELEAQKKPVEAQVRVVLEHLLAHLVAVEARNPQ
jgi:hypothetical protein